MFPIFLDLTDRLAVVVGGGPVGRRKAGALLSAGARVRLIALESAPTANEIIDWHVEPYQAGHLDGASLAFAAATPEVDRRVVADARARRIWVNCAHEPAAGDFFVPSAVRRGDFVLAVGTSGAAPALARKVRERLESEFDDVFALWVKLLGELRAEIAAAIPDAQRRHDVCEHLTDWAWLERLRREGEGAVRMAMREELRRRVDGLLE